MHLHERAAAVRPRGPAAGGLRAVRYGAAARLYDLLSQAFAYPTDYLYDALTGNDFAAVLNESLTHLPDHPALESAHRALHYAAAATVTGMSLLQLESDYIALFDASREREPVRPYARVHADAPVNPPTLLRHLQDIYAEHGLALDSGRAVEQADHLTVQLEFMALLLQHLADVCEGTAPGEEEEALEAVRRFQGELAWLPRFVAALHERAAHPFYTPLATFLLALYETDL